MQILNDGTIIRSKFCDTPPKLPKGYKRKSEIGDGRWIFIPLNQNGPRPVEFNLAALQPEVQMSQPRIQPNGEVHYTKKGKIPPVDLHGYKRKNDNPASPDAWKFAPIFPSCAHRTTQLYRRGCGTTGVHLVCNQTKAICTHENWNPCPDIT